MKLSDYVVDFVAKQGVKHMFMLPGGGAMHLNDSLGKHPDIEFVCNLHEQPCAIAADAYAQYTSNLGVAMVTTGPGGTNAITGVAGSYLDSIPVMILSGQVKRADIVGNRRARQMGFQEINISEIVRPITKYAVTVQDPQAIRYHMEKAAWLARNGRPGPVWIDVPQDVQAADIDPHSLDGFDPVAEGLKAAIDDHWLNDVISRTIEFLNVAERPAILVGNGVRLARAEQAFLSLCAALDVPVLTTWKAIDFFADDDPLYIGRPGAIANRAANLVQQNSDWLLMIGARMDLGQTAFMHEYFARGAKKIMVDIDPAEIEKMRMPIDVPAAVDAGGFVNAFIQRLDEVQRRDRSAWWTRCREWKRRYPVVLPEYWNVEDGVSNYTLVQLIGEMLEPGDVVVPGSSGASSEVTMQALPIKRGVRVLNTQGLGPMGFAISGSIGACVASGRRRTVSLDGDGGFAMNTQELETIRRLNLPVKIFVLDNGGYVSIRTTQKNYFESRFYGASPEGGLTLPDVERIAEAYGIATDRIETTAELREGVRRVLDHAGPVVCRVKITPSQVTAPRVSNRQLPDGRMTSAPMEDLWPFLDREEFRQNMIVPPVE
jgi:acetolactate synthase I/II/III large subunit